MRLVLALAVIFLAGCSTLKKEEKHSFMNRDQRLFCIDTALHRISALLQERLVTPVSYRLSSGLVDEILDEATHPEFEKLCLEQKEN